jgi:hypothetical protein
MLMSQFHPPMNFMDSFFHYVVCLTTVPKPHPKQILHRLQSNASFFNYQCHLISLRSSSSYLCLLFLCLPIISPLPFSIFPSVTCCRRHFLCKMWPIQLGFLFLIVCWIFPSSLTLYNIPNFSNDQSNRSPSFSSTIFQNFSGISDLLSKASKFQHCTMLCSQCSKLLISSWNWSPVC